MMQKQYGDKLYAFAIGLSILQEQNGRENPAKRQ
jgi:hypothetical protein